MFDMAGSSSTSTMTLVPTLLSWAATTSHACLLWIRSSPTTLSVPPLEYVLAFSFRSHLPHHPLHSYKLRSVNKSSHRMRHTPSPLTPPLQSGTIAPPANTAKTAWWVSSTHPPTKPSPTTPLLPNRSPPISHLLAQ
jgi:hypothetical protein